MDTESTATTSPQAFAPVVRAAPTGAPSGVDPAPGRVEATVDAKGDDAVQAAGQGAVTAGIVLTPKAIEMAKKALAKRGTPEAALRLGVRGGGCSGASYVIEFADKVRPRDIVTVHDGLKVVVDPKSLVYLRGAVLDYEVKLMQHGFKFRNPNERSSCGCGESFGI